MDILDSKAQKLSVHSPRSCEFCSQTFSPPTRQTRTCSWQCRFRLLEQAFMGREGCWEWPMGKNKKTGYGMFHAYIGHTRTQYPHRISFLLNKGEIPSGLDVMHSCDNRGCFNPAHLSVGTRKENLDDMRRKGRQRYVNHRCLEDHTNSKLTIDAVVHIRQSDETNAALANRYGVSQSAVNSARRGITWKKVPVAPQSAVQRRPRA
jgi:hypothetical protein